jgi:hypothetical protein
LFVSLVTAEARSFLSILTRTSNVPRRGDELLLA